VQGYSLKLYTFKARRLPFCGKAPGFKPGRTRYTAAAFACQQLIRVLQGYGYARTSSSVASAIAFSSLVGMTNTAMLESSVEIRRGSGERFMFSSSL